MFFLVIKSVTLQPIVKVKCLVLFINQQEVGTLLNPQMEIFIIAVLRVNFE